MAYMFLYIFMCILCCGTSKSARKKNSGPPYAEGIAVGVEVTIVARISPTPRAMPSAQATLYAEGYAVGV
jgi:hypothetical protein